MKMPIGKFKGQPVDAMTTQYLAWLVTQDNIRFKQWPLIKEALRVLRTRDIGAMLRELEMKSPPPDHRPTPEQVEQRRKEKAEKLRQLEARRADEKEQRRQKWRAAQALRTMEAQAEFIRQRTAPVSTKPPPVSTKPPPGEWKDGSYWAREARRNTDISDLI